MNPYLEPQGFLGTGASLLADLTLLAYILLLVPGMIAGLVFARRGMHRPQHKTVMIAITLINWVLIVFLMAAAYRFDVAANIGQQPGNTRYLIPTIHALLGLPAQILATYIVVRMILEDTNAARAKKRGEKNLSRYWFRSAKPVMRLTLILWLLTAAFGVVSYVLRYELIQPPVLGAGAPAPAATEEVIEIEAAPEMTPEPAAGASDATDEPETTPDAEAVSPIEEPAATEDTPVETEEPGS